ncbi:MAG: glycosyltransferase [bacterium]|nr:glycosyltransferase [bacterium]
MKIQLSIVIPAYNEEPNIKRGVQEKVLEYLKKQNYSWEVLFVDDGSADKTAKLLETFAKKDTRIRVIKNPHQGKAATVMTGMLEAGGDIILFSDMDQATPLVEVEKFLPLFGEGYDIVIGSRSGRAGMPLLRKVMAYGFVVLRTIILRLPFKDTQTGFKAFSREAARKVFTSLKIFGRRGVIRGAAVKAGFDLEFLFVARKLGYKIKEVPVEWHHPGTTRVNPLKDSIEGLKDMLLIRFYALKGAYRGR